MDDSEIIFDTFFGHDIFVIENDFAVTYIVKDLITDYDHENISLIYLSEIFKLDKTGYLSLLPEIGQI